MSTTARACDHTVQLYTDDAALGDVVARFVATGATRGEAAIVIATRLHVGLILQRLAAHGFDTTALVERGQLDVIDAAQCLAEFMVGAMPDPDAFSRVVTAALDRARGAGFASVRLYGEMVDLLWQRNLPAAIRLEELWNEVLADRGACLLCAYRIDAFDRFAHRRVLPDIARLHSRLLLDRDEARLDRAVERAYLDVFGQRGETQALRELLLSRHPATTVMPPAQAALMAVRHLGATAADQVLERARLHYADQES
jgi:hypothetical protein